MDWELIGIARFTLSRRECCRTLVLANRGDRAGGAVAQLGEHLLCKQGVSGSIPLSSTKSMVLRLTATKRKLRKRKARRQSFGALVERLRRVSEKIVF